MAREEIRRRNDKHKRTAIISGARELKISTQDTSEQVIVHAKKLENSHAS